LKSSQRTQRGFTLIELVVVIVLLGILASFALPKFSDLTRESRITVLNGIAGSMRATIGIVRSKAFVNGVSIAGSNPGNQAAYIVTTEAGTFEVDWRNLCPESRAELGDATTMAEQIGLTASPDLNIITSNQYTRIGYDIQGSGAPTASGCYVTYNSFGDPNCTVDVITTDC